MNPELPEVGTEDYRNTKELKQIVYRSRKSKRKQRLEHRVVIRKADECHRVGSVGEHRGQSHSYPS